MTGATDTRRALLGLDPATYTPHAVHAGGRSYHETNCWTDIVIELLHAAGCEPLAVLGATLRCDFEGDQFTFFKPTNDDLERLLGVDIHEMQPYRPLPEQLAEQLAAGRSMIVELDAYRLPDTAATSYLREHVKTSCAIEAIDPVAESLTYFHNAGLHALDGEDYREVFRLGRPFDPDVLPPYCELVRFDGGERLEGEALRAEARRATAHHLARRPATNPFLRFGERLADDLPALLAGDEALYHEYAFATVRMAGAAFELAASHVTWLLDDEGAAAAEQFQAIAEGCKVLSFRLARRRAFEPGERIEALAAAWDAGMARLDHAL